jgi:hypothetical protein
VAAVGGGGCWAGAKPSVDEEGSSRGVLPLPSLLPSLPPIPPPLSDRATARPTRPSCLSGPGRATDVDPTAAGAVAATAGAAGGGILVVDE